MAERDSLEVDVLFVGAGPAGLAGAIRLMQLAKDAGKELEVLVIDKAGEIGNHGLSGAVMDPRALNELLPQWRDSAPVESPVTHDELWMLLGDTKIKAPIVPPMMNNSGKYVASLQKITKWMAAQAEDLGAQVFGEFPGQELLYDGDRVIGVRTGDKGIDKHGNKKSNYEPGADIFAKIVVLGEGPRGTLCKQAVARFNLDEKSDPQVYACGVKELWQCPPGTVKPGSVIHTLGYPLPNDTFGGGFIYGMANDILDIGFVTGLDYKDPTIDPHNLMQLFKLHPAVKALIKDAKLIRYGAKAIPEGGYYAMPRLYADGLLITGDSGGFLNGMRLKGIHLAMKSGMLAAETAFEAIAAGDTSSAKLQAMQEKFRASWAYDDLHAARNFHQGFNGGLVAGMLNTGLGMFTGGRGFGLHDHLHGEAGYERMEKRGYKPKESRRATIDGVVTFDKLTDVYNSGTMHEEDQPCHLLVSDTNICRDKCTVEYGNPCQYFCPAKVYEPEFTKNDGTVTGQLVLNFTNCVHCKTCDIADPYQIITWVPPQGGEGPVYTGM